MFGETVLCKWLTSHIMWLQMKLSSGHGNVMGGMERLVVWNSLSVMIGLIIVLKSLVVHLFVNSHV